MEVSLDRNDRIECRIDQIRDDALRDRLTRMKDPILTHIAEVRRNESNLLDTLSTKGIGR